MSESFKMASLSVELKLVYDTLAAKQSKNAHSPCVIDCETHFEDYSKLGYWKNRLLPPDVNLYNKWFGDNVQNCHNGVAILLPTFYSFKKFYRSFTRQELIDIILNPENYIFVNDGVQTTTSGVCCQWDAEIFSLNWYIHYLIKCGLCL